MSQYVTGDKGLIAKLLDLGKKHAGAAIRRGSRAGSKIIAAKMKDAAPDKTGALRQSIKVRALPRKRNVVGTTVKAEAYYAGFTEFGTKHEKGEHFVEKAVDATKEQAMDTFISTMNDEIQKAMKK